MNLSILQRAGQIALGPYPHVVVDDCLPDEVYDELEKTRPNDEYLVDGRPFGSNKRIDLHARQLLPRDDLPTIWRQFIRYHLSEDFWHEILRVFESGLVGFDRAFARQMGGRSLLDMPVTIRTDTSPQQPVISMDVNVGVNTPVVGPATRVRGPHVDNPVELFAAMLYMPPKDADDEGGDFVVYEKSRKVRFEDKAEVRRDDESALSEHVRVKYKRNTMVAFINSRHAIHGVTPRQSLQFRRLVNFCAEVPFSTFTLPR